MAFIVDVELDEANKKYVVILISMVHAASDIRMATFIQLNIIFIIFLTLTSLKLT